MTHIDPRLDKLVEAFNEFKRAKGLEQEFYMQNCHGNDIAKQFQEIADERYRLYKIACERRDRFLLMFEELASAPLKEFPPGSEMTKTKWKFWASFLQDKNLVAACRQISEGLDQ